MTHILKLLSGDRGNPASELDLNQLTAGEIRLTSGGLVPNPGQLNVLYTGESIRYNGELPVKESRGNMRLELRYNIKGGSSADVSRIQREITQFLRDAKLYNQDGQGEAVWLEYRWNTNTALDDLPRPTWGQLNYYAEILSADDVRWPDSVHEQGYLSSNFVEGVICTLTCKPHWYGLEQRCITTPGLMDVTDQANTTLSAGIDFSGQFAISGWFETTDSLAAINYVFVYYIDASNLFQVTQLTNGNIQLTYRVSGSSSTKLLAGNTSAPNHIAVVQGASTVSFYVNGSVATGTLTANAWSGGTLYLGCFTGALTETTTTLDGWRIWEGDTLTAAQVAALYTEEKAIKDAGGWVGKPPYLYTYNATNKVYRGNSTNSGGYSTAIVGNVNGSGVDALTTITINDSTDVQTRIYIGRYAVTSSSQALIYGWGRRDLAIGGTSTANNDSYGNSYQADSWLAAADDSTVFSSYTTGSVNGKWLILARVLSNGDDCAAQVGYNPGQYNDVIYNDAVSISDSTNWQLVEFGGIEIRIPKNSGDTYGAMYRFYLKMVQNTGSAAVSIGADYIRLLPWPYVIIDGSTGSFYKMDLTIHKTLALIDSVKFFPVVGAPEGITLEPGKYNHVTFQFVQAGASVDVDADYLTITTSVIPRWTLPGGLVA